MDGVSAGNRAGDRGSADDADDAKVLAVKLLPGGVLGEVGVEVRRRRVGVLLLPCDDAATIASRRMFSMLLEEVGVVIREPPIMLAAVLLLLLLLLLLLAKLAKLAKLLLCGEL